MEELALLTSLDELRWLPRLFLCHVEQSCSSHLSCAPFENQKRRSSYQCCATWKYGIDREDESHLIKYFNWGTRLMVSPL